ncbi:hypothetical protein Tco_1197101 [Tanacetum coccineum]
MKTTPRNLAYADSDKEAPVRSLAKGFSDRFSLESSGTSDTHRQTRSTNKIQKTPSKNKEPTHLRRSRRLEDRSTTKEKPRKERSKSRGKRSRRQEISSDSGTEEGLEDAYEDLNSPYKRPKPTLLPENPLAVGSAEMVRPSQGDKGYVRPAWSGVPEKARNRGGPREARSNMGVYTSYPRKDTFTPLIKTLKEILAMESVSFPEPPPLIGTLKKQHVNKFCDYHRDRGHKTNDCYQLKKQIEEATTSRKLAHLVRTSAGIINGIGTRDGTVLRTRMRSLGVVGSTIHSMIKFPTDQGVVTMETSKETMRECKHLERVQGLWKEVQWRQHEE